MFADVRGSDTDAATDPEVVAPIETETSSHRPTIWQAVRAPVLTATAAIATFGYFAATNPHQPGILPPCLLLSATGLDCPLCGGSRALHEISRGNIAGALDHNLLVVLAVPVLVLVWVGWLVRRLRQRSQGALSTGVVSARVVILAAGLLLLFGILRNLPWLHYLDSIAG